MIWNIWKRLQSKLINKSILLPSQSVLPNLIQFYFYPCFCMLQKLITSTLIIRLPCCGGHLWGKWKSTAGNRIWPLVTAMIMKTIGNLNPHWENHPPLLSIFFLQFSLSPTVGGHNNTELLIFVLYFHGALWRLLLLLLCTKLTRRMEDQADVKYLVLNHICSIYFSKCFQWFHINLFLHLIEKVSFCLQGIFSKLFRRLRESNTGHG